MRKIYEEMKGQHGALAQTALYIKNRINILRRFLDEGKCSSIAFIGSGSSYSVAKSCEHFYRNLTGRPAFSLTSGDLMLRSENYQKVLENSVIFALSRSGSTSEMINAIECVKKKAAVRVISLTCAEDSPVAALSDFNLCMPWAFDESVCQTRTVSCLFLAGALFAAGLGGRDDLIAGAEKTIGDFEEYALKIEAEALMLAKIKWESAAVLADGELAGIAEEGALAFKEICRVPSNQYGLLDVRHGPIVVIGNRTLVIASLENGHEYEKKLIEDVCAKHAVVITCSGEPVEIAKVYRNFSFGCELDVISRGLALLAVCQYAAYYKAEVKGVNPDMPEGLDAWIEL